VIGQSAGKSFAYILGVYLGDGCVTRSGGSLGFKLNTIDADFAAAVKEAFAELTDRAAIVYRYPVAKSRNENYQLWCSDRALAEELKRITEDKRIIPDFVFQWSRDEKLAFIAGLMDSEGFVAANRGHSGRRYYMGFKSCDPWIDDFVRVLNSVGIEIGKIGIEKPRKPGYKTPRRFTIRMESWIRSGAYFRIARKQRRVEGFAATTPDPRGLRFRAKLTSETTRRAAASAADDIVRPPAKSGEAGGNDQPA
jgi:hypothetical protein